MDLASYFVRLVQVLVPSLNLTANEPLLFSLLKRLAIILTFRFRVNSHVLLKHFRAYSLLNQNNGCGTARFIAELLDIKQSFFVDPQTSIFVVLLVVHAILIFIVLKAAEPFMILTSEPSLVSLVTFATLAARKLLVIIQASTFLAYLASYCLSFTELKKEELNISSVVALKMDLPIAAYLR